MATAAFSTTFLTKAIIARSRLFADWNNNNNKDSSRWRTLDEKGLSDDDEDWQDRLSKKQDGTFWSSFEPSAEGSETESSSKSTTAAAVAPDEDEATELWLDTLQSLSSEEVEFNLKEADRADKARQMEEWGFDRQTITNTLGVAMDTSLEMDGELDGMQMYREQSFLEEVDLQTVESHTQVEINDETGEPVRSQMVYVDEHTCIGCTNCAMIAQSTFFMHQEHGRARVFQQWGDDEETIQIAIETCPVNCIYYVPYEELVALEKDRRNQNINFKGRLVSQAENGNTLSHLSGRGSNAFTAPQIISGNMGSRCSNCPTRGCRDCPMYGVGKNPEFEKREKERKDRIAKRKLMAQRERDQKSVDL